jgi:hypothetical protein
MSVHSIFSYMFSSAGEAICASCGQKTVRFSSITIDDEIWYVCNTDKCKRNILKKLIIKMV